MRRMNAPVVVMSRSGRMLLKNKRWMHRSNRDPPELSRYNYNPDHFSAGDPPEVQQAIKQFSAGTGSTADRPGLKLFTTEQLAGLRHPARPCISLSRDFIHDSLYNPHYGYFSSQVEIIDQSHPSFNPPLHSGADSSPYHGHHHHHHHHHHKHKDSHPHPNYYLNPQQTLAVVPRVQSPPGPHYENPAGLDQRQIWHTPSELFQPWYAWSIASLILEKHLAEGAATHKPLTIYEIGAGNGTLCCGILDYIHRNHPELYSSTRYVTIELSARLAKRQAEKISAAGHSRRATVLNQSILSLGDAPASAITPTLEPCWILGMEVLDNLSRDVIRRDPITLQPFQSIVITDHNGDFHERFIPITKANNPNLDNYLNLLHPTRAPSPNNHHQQHPGQKLKQWLQRCRLKYLPLQSNLTQYQFIPSNYLVLINNLFTFFPNHRLILSDFFRLDHSLLDVNNRSFPGSTWWSRKKQAQAGAPVVQTRYNGMTVPVSTFLVQPGLFDIFFPTDFDELAHVYRRVAAQQRPPSPAPMQGEPEGSVPGGPREAGSETPETTDGPDGSLTKQVRVMDHNQFLFDYLTGPDFKKTLQRFNHSHSHSHSHSHHPDPHPDPHREVIRHPPPHIYHRHSPPPPLPYRRHGEKLIRDFSKDSDLVFNYYQNVKMMVIS